MQHFNDLRLAVVLLTTSVLWACPGKRKETPYNRVVTQPRAEKRAPPPTSPRADPDRSDARAQDEDDLDAYPDEDPPAPRDDAPMFDPQADDEMSEALSGAQSADSR